MEVLRPKPLDTHPGDEIVGWAREQLGIARDILDNPGGGVLFATQTIGQVRAALHERDAARWKEAVRVSETAVGPPGHPGVTNPARLLAGATREHQAATAGA